MERSNGVRLVEVMGRFVPLTRLACEWIENNDQRDYVFLGVRMLWKYVVARSWCVRLPQVMGRLKPDNQLPVNQLLVIIFPHAFCE